MAKVPKKNINLPDQSSTQPPSIPKLCIIGIGASAGGLEALQDFFSHLPALENTSIVVAQHLSPTHKSMLVQLLSRQTKLEVSEATHGKKLEANKIYITPPDKDISIVKGQIQLSKPSAPFGPKPSVDVLFSSLALNQEANIIGIILSGTGSDGALGIKSLKEAGAFTLVQEPQTAKYDGMPSAAINTQAVDVVLPADKMGLEIEGYLQNPESINLLYQSHHILPGHLDRIFQLLSQKTGTDFSNYKSATIYRRLEKRIAQLKLDSLESYLKVIEKNPSEADEMFNMILIGVTTFFRDTEAFASLEGILAKLVETKKKGDTIRIWVPGCSTGEEPYSIAILLYKQLKEKLTHYRIQIFATDIDDRAVQFARKGLYKSLSLEGMAEDIRENYFTKKGNDFELIKTIRSMVLFSKHDLTKNPPYLKLDLISCRNLLIYFNAALQQHVIPVFHYALLPDGYLFLGKSETVSNFGDLFAVVDAKNKLFQRKAGSNIHAIKFSAFKAQSMFTSEDKQPVKKKQAQGLNELVKETIFNTFEHPYVIINEQFDIQEINGDVRLFLSLNSGSIQVNLIKMVNQELQIELRTILTKVVKHKENLKSDIKRFELFGGEYYVRIHAKPLLFNEGLENLYLVIFEKLDIHDFIAKGSLRDKKEIVDEKIAELEQELVATKEHLQTYIEEIETSNEELQSLNEELQSTNEELQSSNEELETSNEELQSTNEEIQIAYTELKAANEELEKKELLLQELQANSLALLNIELQGLILIDNAYQILQFNNKALEIFGKLSGKNLKRGDTFLEIIPRDNIQQFMDDFSQALKGGNYYGEKQFTAALGQTLWFEVNYIPVIYNNQQVKAIALAFQEITDKHVLFDAMQKTEAKLTENEMLILEAQKVAKMGSWNYDFRTDKLTWSEPLYEVFDVDKETFKQTHGSFVSLVDENDKALVNNTSKKAQETGEPFNIVYRITTPKGEKRVIEEFGFSEKDKTGKIVRLFGTAQNITERNQRDEMLKLFHNVIKQSKDAVNISRIKSKEAISPEIIYVNSAFEKLFGYEKNELLGTDNIQLFGPKSDQTELIKLGEAFKNSEATEVTVICYRKDGSTFWNNISSSPVFSMDGELNYWISIQRDVTEVQNKIQLQKFWSEVNTIFASNDLNSSLQFITEKLLHYSECVCTELWMVDKLNNCIHHLHTANLNEQAASFSEETKSANKFEKGNGLPGRIWQHGAVEIIDFDKKNDAKLFKSKAAKKLHLKTAAGFPILFKNEVIGVLVFISNQQAAQFNITASLLKEAGTLLGNEIIRKKTEVENEELFDSAADIICLASLEGYFLKINKAATEKLGYTEEELLSKPYIEFIHPDDKFDTLEIKTAVSQGRSVSYFENRYLTKSGKTIWLSWTTSPTKGETYHFAVARDITKQKEAEQHLKESLQSLSDLKSALDQSFNMVLTDPEGYIIDVNDATTKLSGYSRAELIGSHTRVNRSGYHPQSFYTQMWDTIKDGKIWRGDIHNKRKDGSFYWVDTIIVPMKNARGEIINYLAIRTDITKRKEDTENLNILNQNLAKKAHELAISNTELEQFAVVASRDLQEPLRMVSSFMSQLKKKYGESLDEKANQYIDFAANGAKDMREIILDLLEFSRVGSDEESIEPFNVNDIIHEVKLMEKRIIEEHQVIIQTELLPNINWFKNSFRKIVMQLVDNAIKYRQVGRTPLINISSIEYQDHWVFAIHDNGIGIEEEYFEKIFIVFQKLHPKENYPGTGMGLSIVKKLVESAGGKIWLNSKLGEGSTFYFSVNKLHVNK